MLDLEAREQRNIVAVALHALHVVGHDVGHEGLRLLVDVVGVDQDLADIGREVIADRPDDQTRFLIDEVGRRIGDLAVAVGLTLGVGLGLVVLGFSRLADLRPQFEQVAQIPLELLVRPADAGGAADDAHALRDRQAVHHVAQLVAVFAFDPPRHAAAARVVGHQDEIASRQADERGECRALGAALVFFDLDDDIGAFGHRILDTDPAGFDVALEVGARDLLEGEKAVAFGTVVDERGLETGLDAGDDTLVDVALTLFFRRRLDVEVDELLTVHDGNP